MKRLLWYFFTLFILITSTTICYYFYTENNKNDESLINYFTCEYEQYFANRVPENPMFSIVLSTYNRADYLPRAICSVLAQQYTNFEFIIIDDGSSDNTEQVVNKFAKKDKRIRYIKNEQNSGLVYSLNRGVNLAKGKYITRLDDDDYLFPEFFVEYVKFIDKYPDTILIYSLPVSVKDNGDISEILTHSYRNLSEIDVFSINSVPNIGATLKKDFLVKNNLTYNEKYKAAEDYKLIADILVNGGKIRKLDKILTGYRIHKTNGKKYENNRRLNSRRIQGQLKKFFSDKATSFDCETYKGLNDKIYQVFTKEQVEDAIKKYCR